MGELRRLDLGNPFGGSLFYTASCPSTMDWARELWQGGEGQGTVAWSAHQSQGRGRLPGRSWENPPGTALLFTLALDYARLPENPPPPLLAALGVARYLQGLGISGVKIKWPNDVLVKNHKIAGILCQALPEALLTGIGFNLLPRDWPQDLRRPAISLAELLAPEKAPRPSQDFTLWAAPWLEALLVSLWGTMDRSQGESGAYLTECRQYLWGLDQAIEFQTGIESGEPWQQGIFRGIGRRGQMLLEIPGVGIQDKEAGEWRLLMRAQGPQESLGRGTRRT